MAEWITDSNEALSLCLRRDAQDSAALSSDAELAAIQPFQPIFTYPIFGEDQKIYGYQGLDIQLHFTSGSLRQLLQVSHDAKIPSSSTPADDVSTLLTEFLAPDHTTSSQEFEARLSEDATTFRPFGAKIAGYTRPSGASTEKEKGKGKGKAREEPSSSKRRLDAGGPSSEESDVQYEMWKTSWDDEGFKEYHRRMQFFILMYIEGGTYIQEDEENWEFIVLYEKRLRPFSTSSKRTAAPSDPPASNRPDAAEASDASPEYSYHFVGFTSLYPFYHYPDMTRLRLSQFVILPPYQDQGHGSALYYATYAHVASRPLVAELTIEDPAEAFEDLRDVCDLRMLERAVRLAGTGANGWPSRLDGKTVADRAWIEAKRKELKIASRQFSRLVEMMMLSRLKEDDQVALRAYRLFVKERLYRFNYEILSQLEKHERIEKLEETFQAVKADYRRILDRAAIQV